MLLMVPMAGSAMDIYVPSLPAMEKTLNVSEWTVQSTLLVFMAFYGIGQIISGPLTDTFGRRWPIVISTSLFTVASVGIACGPDIEILIVLRSAQGLFASVASVGARAIIADCYEGVARIRTANWMTIAWSTGPILSPALGGYLQEWYGWTASFWFLSGWGVFVVLIALAFLPETRENPPMRGFIKSFAIYRTMVTDRVYLPTAVAMSCMISVMFGFEVLGPFYIQTDLGRGPVDYGHLQLILGSLWLAGNLFNRFVSPYIRVIRLITTATGLSFLISMMMVVLDLSGVFSVLALMIPAGAIYFMMATVWPNGYATVLGRFPDSGGSSNALVSGVFIFISAILTCVAALFHSATAWPLWVLYTFLSGASFLIFVVYLRGEFRAKVR